MDNTVTPEKVKNLLSSFLIQPQNFKQKEQEATEIKDTDKNTEASVPVKTCSTNILRSYTSFCERLESFSALTWFGKASDLSPLVCARYGWENVDTNMLQCIGCKSFLSGHLPDKSDLSAYEESYNKLKRNLVASHDKFCVLAANPCPEHFCHVSIEDPTLLTAGFTERVNALKLIQDRLPCLELKNLQSLGYDEGQSGAYCKRHLMPDCETTPQVVTLAFTGWTYCLSKKDVLRCSMCLRQIGIWNYLPLSSCSHYPTLSESEIDERREPVMKKKKTLSAFDPIEEHNHWCPWIQPTFLPMLSLPTSSESNTHHFPACVAALKVIAPGLMDNNKGLACTMKTSPMVEGLRCFRRVMKSWSSKKPLLSATSPSN